VAQKFIIVILSDGATRTPWPSSAFNVKDGIVLPTMMPVSGAALQSDPNANRKMTIIPRIILMIIYPFHLLNSFGCMGYKNPYIRMDNKYVNMIRVFFISMIITCYVLYIAEEYNQSSATMNHLLHCYCAGLDINHDVVNGKLALA